MKLTLDTDEMHWRNLGPFAYCHYKPHATAEIRQLVFVVPFTRLRWSLQFLIMRAT